MKQPYKCHQCGKTTMRYASQVLGMVFCSVKCSGDWVRAIPLKWDKNKVCVCGATFTAYGRKQRFCSISCSSKGKNPWKYRHLT